jgi:hypothetical protein
MLIVVPLTLWILRLLKRMKKMMKRFLTLVKKQQRLLRPLAYAQITNPDY